MPKYPHNLDAEWAQYKTTGSVAARNRILEAYLPLVRDIAGKVLKRLPHAVELDDLVSSGTLGLIAAAQAFDPGRGLRFSTYASKRIFGAIIDGLRQFDWVPRITRHRTRLLTEAVAAFEAEHGRPPTADEARLRLGVGSREFRLIRNDQAVGVSSLSRVAFESDGSREQTELDHLHDEREQPPDAQAHTREVIGVIVREFRLTDSLFVKLYYLEGMTLKQVAEALGGLSEASMSFRKKNLMRRLRARFAPQALEKLKARAA